LFDLAEIRYANALWGHREHAMTEITYCEIQGGTAANFQSLNRCQLSDGLLFFFAEIWYVSAL